MTLAFGACDLVNGWVKSIGPVQAN